MMRIEDWSDVKVVLEGDMWSIPEAGSRGEWLHLDLDFCGGFSNWYSTRIGVQSVMVSLNASVMVVVPGLGVVDNEGKVSGEERSCRLAE
jgi:hypothetical protein